MVRSWCVIAWASMLAACNSETPLPPVLNDGVQAPYCAFGRACPNEGNYCIASHGAGCDYLECTHGVWQCAPEGGLPFDASHDGSGDAAGEAAPDSAHDAPSDAASDASSD